ncbi:NPSR1-like protein [Mya arenaria]|uniref:NPSR1-like protein n=1 Tax=Mya arenaria TaxID=6604 RepID=A0ABY7E1F2_MYAAR|nr:NPSR1-like protein [Mya arenaria]
MAVIIVGLNGLVIFTLSRQKGNNRLHFFIRHLAIADLLVGLIAVTGDALNIGILHAEWLAGDVTCRMHRYACYVILIVSNNLLIGMSVDRFLAVKCPLRKITGAFFVCWMPATLIYLFDVHRLNFLESTTKRMLERLYPLNSLCNPLIFIMFNTKLFTCRKKNAHAHDKDNIGTHLTIS